MSVNARVVVMAAVLALLGGVGLMAGFKQGLAAILVAIALVVAVGIAVISGRR